MTLWGYVRIHRAALAAALGLTLAASVAALAQPLAAKAVVDALSVDGQVATPLVLLGALVLVSAAAAGLGSWLLDRAGEKVVRGIRRNLSFRMTRLQVRELDRQVAGNLVTRATSDSNLVRTAATTGLVQLVDGTLSFVATMVLMLFLDLRLTLVTAAVLAVVGAIVGVILPRIRAAVTRTQAAIGVLGAALDRALGAARSVKANGAEARETARIDVATETSYQAGLVAARYTALVVVVSELSLQASFLVVLGLGGAFVAAGSLTVSTLVAFLLALFYLAAPITSLTTGATELQQGLAAMTRLRGVTDLEIEDDVDDVPAGRSPPPSTNPRRAPRIQFDGVTFAYPGRTPALRGLSVMFPPNAVSAVVGPSGAGKSTIFALMQRFYELDRGTIHLDDRDIGTMSKSELRRRLAWVDQDAAALSGTLAENLRFGMPEATDTDLRAALHEVRLENLLHRLPQGWDSEIGERGSILSGGERQRLVIARALLRHPDVLLLDEATSHLDTVNDNAVRDIVTTLSRTTTVVIIAHRIATVTAADHIVVIDAGQVVATGTHRDLLQTNLLYHDLATTSS